MKEKTEPEKIYERFMDIVDQDVWYEYCCGTEKNYGCLTIFCLVFIGLILLLT